MNRTEKLALIRDAFGRLHALNNICWTPYRERLFDLCETEEKEHRGFGPDFRRYHPNAVSVADTARMFSVKRVAEYLNGEKMPHARQFIHIQRSAFFAASLVANYRKEIRKAWKGLPIGELAALDYCEFVQVKKEGGA
jgi:hypothetical protein